MESSFEDEFGWTSASSDATGSDSEADMVYEEESESGISFKKKLKKELLLNGTQNEHDESTDEKPRHKKKVKREKESQSPSPTARLNGHDASLDAEHLLRTKVKEERAGLRVSDPGRGRSESCAETGHETPRKRKRHRYTERDSAADRVDFADAKKKKKKRKRESSQLESSIDETPDPIIDKFEAEDTVVETRRPEPKVKNKSGEPEKPFTSKEFIEDDDDSEEERPAPPPVTPPRAPRISERITFEDEPELPPSASPAASSVVSLAASPSVSRAALPSVSSAASPSASRAALPSVSSAASPSASRATSPSASRAALPSGSSAAARAASPPGRLGRFLRSHAHMQPVIGALPRDAAVGPDDDVWLLRCPHDLPAEALLGVTLRTDARRKLTAGGRAYEAAPAPCGARVALLAGAARAAGFTVRAVRLRGALRLRERVPRVRAPSLAPEPEPERIPLPATRPRHPLLGAEYRRAARLPRDVRRRLRAAASVDPEPGESDAERRRDKGKKKKRRERPEPRAPAAPEPEPEPEPERAPRKRKRSTRNENETEEPRESEKPERAKKDSKEKRRRDDAALWDSERAIEESLFGC